MASWQAVVEDWLDFLEYLTLVTFAWLDMLAYMEAHAHGRTEEATVINFADYKAR